MIIRVIIANDLSLMAPDCEAADVRQLKINYRIEELFLKHGLKSGNEQRVMRLVKNFSAVLAFQLKPEYFVRPDGVKLHLR